MAMIKLEDVERKMNEFGLGNALLPEDVRFLYRVASWLPRNSQILEIGTQCGRSTRVFSLVAKQSRIITIDIDNAWGGDHDDNIVRIIANSSDVAKITFVNIDLLFIDGDHTAAGIQKDIDSWYPKLKRGGLLIFHDYHPNHPDVIKVVNKFQDNKQLKRIMPNAEEIGTACYGLINVRG